MEEMGLYIVMMYVHGGIYNEVVDTYCVKEEASTLEDALRMASKDKSNPTDTIAAVERF